MDDKNPQKELVTKTALEDLQRRRAEIAPQVDRNIEEVLRICEQRLDQASELRNVDWDAEFNFWHKIISQEVERLRFNQGYEPIQADLYPAARKSGPAFLGKTQIGHLHFRVEAKWQFDKSGNKVLRITLLKAQ